MKKRFHWKLALTVVLAVMMLCTAQSADASGFAVYTQGAAALGQGNSAAAHLEAPSAIFLNPALINRLEGTKLEVGTTGIWPSREFKGDSGNTFKSESSTAFPSTLYLTHKVNDELSLGLGIFNPFGLGSEWNESWEGKYIATKSDLKTFNINPVAAYQVLPNLSIAAGLDYIILNASLEKKMNFSGAPFFSSDGNQKFEGDGTGYGFNLGILFDVNDDVAIGASYRSEVEVEVDGDATFSNIPVPASALFPNTAGKTTITLPAQVHAGIAYKGVDKLTLEAGLRWEGWSSYNELRFDFDQAVAGSKVSAFPKNWDDTFALLLGGEYQLDDMVALRAGYIKSGTPVPDDTFEPSIPDADTDIYTLGIGIAHNNCSLDLAYSFQDVHERHKSNTVDDNAATAMDPTTSANGRYGTELHMLGVSLTHSF